MLYRASLVALIAVVLSFGIALAKNKEIKVKAKGAKEKIDPGGTGTVTVKLKNRTNEEQEVPVSLLYQDNLEDGPFVSATITLKAKETVTEEFDVPVPEAWFDKKLRVITRIPDAETKAKVKTIPAEFTDEFWLQGEALFQQECRSCHGKNGWKIKNKGLSSWISNSRNGPGSMPRYPHLTRADFVLMYQYAKDGKRVVD
jgi:hypothetical protein